MNKRRKTSHSPTINNSETDRTFKLALVPVWLRFPHLLNRHSRVPIWILLSHQIGASTKTKWPRKALSSGERMNSAGENAPQRLRTQSRMATQWEYATELYSASRGWIHMQDFVWNMYMMNVNCLTPEELSVSFLYLSYKNPGHAGNHRPYHSNFLSLRQHTFNNFIFPCAF